MNREQLIRELDAEIQRFRQARELLSGGGEGVPSLFRLNGRRRAVRHMSAEARARISAAQKARWAKVKAGHKKK